MFSVTISSKDSFVIEGRISRQFGSGGGALIYNGVHMHEQKTCEKGSFYFFAVGTCKTGGIKCHFSGKRGGFCQNLLKNFQT